MPNDIVDIILLEECHCN